MTISKNDPASQEQNSGFGLVTALMFVLLVAAVITPLAVVSRSQVLASTYSARRAAFELLAPGLSRVIYAVYLTAPMITGWQRCEAKDKVFYLHIQDQNGLIDLNSASNSLLTIGFRALGYNEFDATHFADRVLKYREIGSVGQSAGSDPTFVAKHAPFENIAELNDILAPSGPAIDRFAVVFTIYNKTDSVTVSHSSRILREQLKLRENEEQFAGPGELPSGHAEISFAEFRTGEPFGFLSKIMMARSNEPGAPAKILQRETTFTGLDTLGLERQEPTQCPAFLRKVTENL
jgi:general secretion pathway protein K